MNEFPWTIALWVHGGTCWWAIKTPFYFTIQYRLGTLFFIPDLSARDRIHAAGHRRLQEFRT